MDPTNMVTTGSPLIKANMPNPPGQAGSAKIVENMQSTENLTGGGDVTKSLQAGESSTDSAVVSGQQGQQEIDTAVENVNNFFQTVNRTLAFKLDEDSENMVVQVTDSETKEVVRQIPSEEFLKLAQRLEEFRGLLFEEIA
jgi:flagellar protein FlaG